MAALKLVIGNKNYSSWSMRPWLALRANDIAFDEVFIPLYTDKANKDRILSVTLSGKVPALIDGDSRSGIRLRSSNTSRKNSRRRGCGRRTLPPAPMPARSRRRCIRASRRYATNAA